MPKPEFEEVSPEERRYQPVAVPTEWHHRITEEQLSKVDAITGERWKLANIEAQQIEWLMHQAELTGNILLFLEGEAIRSAKFRKYIWTRITIAFTVGAALVWLWEHVFGK